MKKIVILHGLGQSRSSWSGVAERLDGIAECRCPELAELCGSPAEYGALYKAFSAYCAEFGGDPLELVGLSLGGMLALNYAIENPSAVKSLVLIGTQYKSPKALLKLQNAIFKIMPRSSFKETGFGKADFISLCRSMGELDLTAALGKVSCPTLILVGERDKPNHKAALEMSERIKGSSFHIVEGAGHEVNLDTPERLCELIKSFYETEKIL